MSTDWHVHCVDCNDTHRFDDANRATHLMTELCKNAALIAQLGPLVGIVDLSTGYGQVDPAWFAKHLGHRLVPIDEYGGLLTQCHEYVRCGGGCGCNTRCTKDLGHDGDHDTTPRTKRP